MGNGTKGKLIEAHYSNCLLNGIFKDENGNKFKIINAKGAHCDTLIDGKRLFIFMKDSNDPNQDYLESFCMTIKISNTRQDYGSLQGEDFLNQEECYIFLCDNE